jgi:hypothetical protein
MKQGTLPLVPSGTTGVGDKYSVSNNGETVVWFHGWDPIRAHPSGDHLTYRAMMARTQHLEAEGRATKTP